MRIYTHMPAYIHLLRFSSALTLTTSTVTDSDLDDVSINYQAYIHTYIHTYIAYVYTYTHIHTVLTVQLGVESKYISSYRSLKVSTSAVIDR